MRHPFLQIRITVHIIAPRAIWSDVAALRISKARVWSSPGELSVADQLGTYPRFGPWTSSTVVRARGSRRTTASGVPRRCPKT